MFQPYSALGLEQRLYSRKRITQRITRYLIVVIVLQLSKLLYLPHPQSHLINAAIHISLFLLCLILIKHCFMIARYMLIGSFISYIVCASLLWQFNLNVQYFLLLGMFVSQYLFSEHEKTVLWITLCVLCVCFVYLQFSLPYHTYENNNAIPYALLIKLNCVTLTIACLLCAHHIRSRVSNNWQLTKQRQQHGEQTLHALLPVTLSTQLLDKQISLGQDVTQTHAFVSVIFIDLCNFTAYCQAHTDTEVVNQLHQIYLAFDKVAAHFNVTKIKTNGDQYMAAVGLESKLGLPRAQCIAIACAFAQAIRAKAQTMNGSTQINLRIGIASGHAVSGIIGHFRPAYDLWGDTVNLAARLESHAQTNSIDICHISMHYCPHSVHLSDTKHKHLKGFGYTPYYTLIGNT